MTTEQAAEFISKLTPGTEVYCGNFTTMVVTHVIKKCRYPRFIGYSKEQFEKTGKKHEISVFFSTLTNPHYGDRIQIIK